MKYLIVQMEGYSHVFQHSINKFKEVEDTQALFASFRSERDIYGFTENMDVPPDEEAVAIAKSTNPDLYASYLRVLEGRKAVGYERSGSNYSAYNNLDSRHIMMSVFLFTKLPESISTIIEIGGGYGNWLYLNQKQAFTSWVTIDLPHVSELQKWYLKETGVNTDRWTSVSAYDYDAYSKPVDLVIGAHSLSELSFSLFYDYFQKILMHTKYFYYCYHMTRPSPQLISAKNVLIQSRFKEVASFLSEGGTVMNCLYSA